MKQILPRFNKNQKITDVLSLFEVFYNFFYQYGQKKNADQIQEFIAKNQTNALSLLSILKWLIDIQRSHFLICIQKVLLNKNGSKQESLDHTQNRNHSNHRLRISIPYKQNQLKVVQESKTCRNIQSTKSYINSVQQKRYKLSQFNTKISRHNSILEHPDLEIQTFEKQAKKHIPYRILQDEERQIAFKKFPVVSVCYQNQYMNIKQAAYIQKESQPKTERIVLNLQEPATPKKEFKFIQMKSNTSKHAKYLNIDKQTTNTSVSKEVQQKADENQFSDDIFIKKKLHDFPKRVQEASTLKKSFIHKSIEKIDQVSLPAPMPPKPTPIEKYIKKQEPRRSIYQFLKNLIDIMPEFESHDFLKSRYNYGKLTTKIEDHPVYQQLLTHNFFVRRTIENHIYQNHAKDHKQNYEKADNLYLFKFQPKVEKQQTEFSSLFNFFLHQKQSPKQTCYQKPFIRLKQQYLV